MRLILAASLTLPETAFSIADVTLSLPEWMSAARSFAVVAARRTKSRAASGTSTFLIASVNGANACLALLAMTVVLLFSGWLGDRIPRRLILRAGSLLLVVASIPFYLAVQGHHVNLIFMMLLCGVAGGVVNGVFASVIADLFPTRVRYSGVALAFNVSFTVFSGTAPLIATWLISSTGSSISPAYFMMLCAAITFLATFRLKTLSGRIVAPA